MNLAAKLPQTTDPCGQIQYELAENLDEHQPIARIDYQVTSNQLIFGRYLGTKVTIPAPWEGPGDNILKTSTAGTVDQLHAVVGGSPGRERIGRQRDTVHVTPRILSGASPGVFSPAMSA